MQNQPALSEAEREVLKVLWDRRLATVREINVVLEDRGRHWAYTTVATLLQHLAVKGYVTSDPSVIPHVYRAAITRDELLDRHLKDAAAEFCDGQAAPLVLALVQGNRFSAEEIRRFRQVLDEGVKGNPSPPKLKS